MILFIDHHDCRWSWCKVSSYDEWQLLSAELNNIGLGMILLGRKTTVRYSLMAGSPSLRL